VHGHLSQIYFPNGALTSPPALEVVLAPVILLGQGLGLTPHLRTPGVPLSLWYVLGPAALLIGSTVLFAVDAVARQWQLPERHRLLLALATGLGALNVACVWGHPEDCLSLALVLWAALTLERDAPGAARHGAWLLGAAIAFQPLAVLGVAPVLARLGWRKVSALSYCVVVPSVVVLIAPLAGEAHRTISVLVRQPFQPSAVSSTPLSHWAPTLGPGVAGGGPARLVATVLGVLVCVAVCRRRFDLETVLAMMSIAFFLRVLFETELNWYYVWPVAALCVLLALRGGLTRYWICAVALVASMVLGNHRVHHIALWWPALMATLVVMLMTVFVPLGRWRATTSTSSPPAPERAVECDAMTAQAAPAHE
jgi:hypothetical protein